LRPCASTSRDKSTSETPSFVCEVPLRVSPAHEKVLLARLEAARQLYNACLGEAVRRIRLIQQSRLWQKAWKVEGDFLPTPSGVGRKSLILRCSL